ncbi:MAG: nucleoside phosphorylase [Planctomycetota bacterium]|jgi:nucleoside phosphorylase
MKQSRGNQVEGGGRTGVLCALPLELGCLADQVTARLVRGGRELLEIKSGPHQLLACVSGVGKVQAAHATGLLIAEGISRLLIVGTCGGLRRHLGPGTLLHCEIALQTDLAVREGRESCADSRILAAWRAEVPASAGYFLTADRPVMSIWRRFRLARAFVGDCVADMESAAAAAVATRTGVPWGALRAVTDRAGPLGAGSFQVHYPAQAGRAADTIPDLLDRLESGQELPSYGQSR